MFLHNFKYSFLSLFKDRALIFWTFAFPLIMATFFSLAFSGIEKSEMLQTIQIAVVNDEVFLADSAFSSTFEELGNEKNPDRVFQITNTTLEEAEELFASQKVIGYLQLLKEGPKVVIKKNGIEETIFQNVVAEIVHTKELVRTVGEEKIKEELESGNQTINYELLYQNVLQTIETTKVTFDDQSSKQLSYTMIEYYTLIAMTCLYGATLGMCAINNTLANMSKKGMRVEVSPIKKGKLLFSSICASYVVQLIGLGLLFLYTILFLHVDYGNRIGLILLLAFIGTLAGLSFGVFIGSVFKTNENMKVGIIISFTMFGCFLSGMMGITMKYIIDKNIPLLNQLNPANMITDGFYALYYYQSLNRYWFNIISLILFSLILIGISIFVLRRKHYDHI